MVFPVGMYGCESWTIKNAECQRMDAFELRCWRRLLRVPWTARRSNQSILKEISPEYSLEGLMLKLKLQYFDPPKQRTDSLEKTWCWERLKAGGEGDNRGWDGWMASPNQGTWVWASSGRWWRTGKPGVLHSVGHIESDTTEWLTEQHCEHKNLSYNFFLSVSFSLVNFEEDIFPVHSIHPQWIKKSIPVDIWNKYHIRILAKEASCQVGKSKDGI